MSPRFRNILNPCYIRPEPNTKSMSKVVIRNEKGAQKEVPQKVWELMGSSKEPGTTRKGWTLVGTKGEKKAPVRAASVGAVKKEQPFVVVPPEIAEAAKKAEDEKLGGMIAGTSATEDHGQASVQEDVDAQAQAETEEKDQPPPAQQNKPPKADNLASLPQLGPKVQEALNAAGIYSFAQLAASQAANINGILEGAGMGPKKAQVPGWISKAKDIAAGKTPNTNTAD